MNEFDRQLIAGKNAMMFKPKLDTRTGDNIVSTRYGKQCRANNIENIEELKKYDADIYFIDEFQFLKGDIKTIEEERAKFFAAGDDLMGIQNLTLLTEHDNRGIGNKFFFEKRQILQEYYQQGSFIPACSMNVFMKFYSDNPEQMAFWDEQDRESYKNKLESTIKKFFGDE